MLDPGIRSAELEAFTAHCVVSPTARGAERDFGESVHWLVEALNLNVYSSSLRNSPFDTLV